MVATSSEDIEDLIDRHRDKHDWERDKAHVQNTSKVIRQLVQAIVETGPVDKYAMRTVYNLCQNDDVLQPENKRERIGNLDIDSTARSEIKERIDGETGIVGKGTYSVPTRGHEEEAFNLLSTAIRPDNRDEIDPAIEEFVNLEIERIQNGIISPILYSLRPIRHLISNHRLRTGMREFFSYEMSGRLTSHLIEAEKFHEVRMDYPFKNDFRYLDSFFNRIEEQEPVLGEQSTKPVAEIFDDANLYWMNQHNPPEIGKGCLRTKTDELWYHNLDKLSVGNVVFHNFDNELTSISTVIENAEVYTSRDEEYYRVEVDPRSFGEPVPVDGDLKKKPGQGQYRTEKYYSTDKNSNLNEAYLANLSRPAAEFLLSQVDSIEESETPVETSGSPRRI